MREPANPFQKLRFLTSANDSGGFPTGAAREVAFVGRSNAGKSSAINVIAGQRGLAHVSKTPGRTRLINFFELDAARRVVDLPGYGYAAVDRATREHWEDFLAEYVATRADLVGVVMIADARHALADADRDMLGFLLKYCRPVHVLLTKSDKLSRSEAAKVLARVRKELAGRPSVDVQLFSATSRAGVAGARDALARWLQIEQETLEQKKAPETRGESPGHPKESQV